MHILFLSIIVFGLTIQDIGAMEITRSSKRREIEHSDHDKNIDSHCNQASQQLLQAFEYLIAGDIDEDSMCTIVTDLLEQGANLNTFCQHNYSPLLSTLYPGQEYVELTQLLLDNGADVNIKNKYGETALLFAIRRRKVDSCALLLARGAWSSLSPELLIEEKLLKSSGKPAKRQLLSLLIRYGLIDVSKIKKQIIQTITPNPLLQAVMRNNVGAVAYLLGEPLPWYEGWRRLIGHSPTGPISPDAVDEQGATALSYAAGMGNAALVTLLLNHGASPFLTDRWNIDPLAIVELRLKNPYLTKAQRAEYMKIKHALMLHRKKILGLLSSLQRQGNLPAEMMAIIAQEVGVVYDFRNK